MSLTRKIIIEILQNNVETTRDGLPVIFPDSERFDRIADEIMAELNKKIKPKRECLSGISRDGKHQLIVSDDGVYCGVCGLDMATYNE